MKKAIKLTALLMALVLSVLLVASCADKEQDVWEGAVYTLDTTLGEGTKVLTVEVKADEKAVVFTVNTDKDTLGAALIECGLAEGEDGPYGLYIKKVNGILADYDVNQYYWSFSKDGAALMTGADGEKINGGEHYEIVRAK